MLLKIRSHRTQGYKMEEMNADSIADSLEAGMTSLEDSQGSEASEVNTLDEGRGTEGGTEEEGEDKSKTPDWEKDYRELQSHTDKKLSEMTKTMQDTMKENAKLAGMMEAIKSHQQTSSNAELEALNQREQDAFDKEWAEKIEENPAESIKFYRQMAREQIALQQAQMKREMEAFKKELNLDERLRKLQPGWKENQEKIQQTAKELDVSLDVAQKIVEKYETKGGISQPSRPDAPGTVDEGKRTGKAEKVEPMALTDLDVETMRMAGLSQKEINAVATKAAKSMAT